MSTLYKTLICVIVLTCGLYIPLHFFIGVSSEGAAGIAALPLVGAPHLADLFEKYSTKQDLERGQYPKVFELDGFSYKWTILIIITPLIIVGMIQFISGLTGLISGSAAVLSANALAALIKNEIGEPDDLGYGNSTDKIVSLFNPENGDMSKIAVTIFQETVIIIALCLILLLFTLTIYLGRWLGVRCKERSYLMILLSVVIGVLISGAVNLLFMDEKTAELITKSSDRVPVIIDGMISQSIICTIGIFTGYWLGRRRKVYAYFNYLLDVLPATSKKAFVDLVQEEAIQALSAKAVGHSQNPVTQQVRY